MEESAPNFNEQLQERLRFETLIAELSSRFVSVPADRVDREIEGAQCAICECLSIEHSSLWQSSESDPNEMVLTHLFRGADLSELIARETVDYLLNRWPQGGIKKSLSPRQAQILKLLVEGNSMKRVADILDISPGTVAFHKYNMMRELRINSNAEFLQYAMRNHMISARPDMRLQMAVAGQD